MSDALMLPGMSATGFALDPTMSLETYGRTCWSVGAVRNATMWAIGDLVIFGEDVFGEAAAQFLNDLHYDPHTIKNAVSVCRKFPPSKRRPLPITFSHHARLVKVDDPDKWLDETERCGWTIQQLEDALKDAGYLGGHKAKKEEEPEPELHLTLNPDGSIQAIKFGETFCITHGKGRNVYLDVANRRFTFVSPMGVKISEQKLEQGAA